MTTEEIAEFVGTVAYELGEAAGFRRSEAEAKKAWLVLREQWMPNEQRTSSAERAAVDAEYVAGVPCKPRCGRCSRCIRASAVARHGGDYTGGPVAWNGE